MILQNCTSDLVSKRTFVPNPKMIRYNQELLKCVSEIAKKSNIITEKQIKAQAKILVQNEAVSYIYIIKEGIAKCYITESNGKDYILEFMGSGEIVGELEILHNTKSLTNIEAISNLQVLRIHRDYFLEMLQQNWQLNLLILKELAQRLAQTSSRASYQQNYPLEYSILKIIYLFSNQPLQLSKKDLADYLGITVRSLNRTLLALQQKGILHTDSIELKKTQNEISQMLFQYENFS